MDSFKSVAAITLASPNECTGESAVALYRKSLARNHKRNHNNWIACSVKHGAQLTLSGFGMDDRVVDILAALCVAAVAAVIAWFVAPICLWRLQSRHSDISPDGCRHLRPANGASVVRKETEMTQVS